MKVPWLLAACAACSLGGSRPSYNYYVLTPKPGPAPTGPVLGQRTLGVDRVTVPGYLDREQIATRTAGQRLTYSRADRWAEPLDQAFERTLADDLASQLVPHGIQVLSHAGHSTYELSVDIVRFERTGAAQVELRARWVLRAETDVLDSGEILTQVPMAGTDSNAMAAALSDAIGRMAMQLADRVQQTDAIASKEHGAGAHNR
jgi:uncharacterized lipoprotein YmbA